MKRMILSVAILCLFASTAYAAKTTYIVTNKRFNYVKLKEVDAKVAAARDMTHPATVDESGLRAALASINLSRSYLIKKEVDTQQVFDDFALNFLTPALVQAFSQASANEEVVFSYLSKNPYFVLRNDRINICQAWIHGNELHVKFGKLYAKVVGDVDKRGNEDRAISRAVGLRIKLEMGDGQKMGIDDPEEIVLDMHYDYVKKPEAPKEPESVTMAGEKSAPDEEGAAGQASGKKAKGKKAMKEARSGEQGPQIAAPAPEQKSAKERLEALEQLKKDKLITRQEYEEKKKEILKDL